MNKKDSQHSGPNVVSALLEVRALFEMATAAAWAPLLRRAARGDGHPVVVVPAFMTSDRSTAMLRRYLNGLGFRAYGWKLGRNTGIRQESMDGLLARVRSLSEAHGGRKVSVIGWSLGGVYARALGSQQPELVRQVITLGSPFNVPDMSDEKVSGAVLKLYEMLNPGGFEDPMLDDAESWRQPPPVPSTAIFSEGDGIASWKYCVDQPGDRTENLRVPGSHLGLTHNAAVLYAVADRLAHTEESWQPFNLNWLRRRFYGAAPLAEACA